jgi:uncharacterized phage protein gp47/JayE
MGTFLTATGFIKKTLAEIKSELETEYKAIFGDNIDLDDTGPIGQLISVQAKKYADLWDLADEINNSRDVTQATGVALDSIVAEIGVKRLSAVATKVENVLLIGDEGTLVSAGNQAKQTNSDLLYSLLANVTITKSNALKLKLEPNTTFPLSGGEVFTVTLDTVAYTYNGIAADTKKIVIDALVSSITGGAFVGTASNENDQFLVIDGKDSDGNSIPDTAFISLWTSTFNLEQLASGGDFQADETGPNALPSNTLDTIATPVSGWNDVNNPAAGVTGINTETDDELRIRFALTFLAGNSTDEAIKNNLLNEVDDIISAVVISNREYVTGTQKVVWDADFVTGNNIDITVNGTPVTTVPFNTDQSTTMSNLKTQIETDISNSTVTIDILDSNERTLIINVSTTDDTRVTENVTGGASQAKAIITYTDADGRPPKSFEAVVEGGTDADVAQVIWDSMPSGIESYGNTSVVIQDVEGNNQTIKFSRPVSKYVWVRVKRDLNPEETYPTDGDTQIKNNIVEWSLLNLDSGDDVIRQRLSDPIYEVSGISDIEIGIDYSNNIGHTPSYSLQNVPVLGREKAIFDVSRIIVEDLTP